MGVKVFSHYQNQPSLWCYIKNPQEFTEIKLGLIMFYGFIAVLSLLAILAGKPRKLQLFLKGDKRKPRIEQVVKSNFSLNLALQLGG